MGKNCSGGEDLNLRPWSRTRFSHLLNPTAFCRRQAIGVEGFELPHFYLLISVELRWFDRYKSSTVQKTLATRSALSLALKSEMSRKFRRILSCAKNRGAGNRRHTLFHFLSLKSYSGLFRKRGSGHCLREQHHDFCGCNLFRRNQRQ